MVRAGSASYALTIPSKAELVFGLDWFVIMGTDAPAQARRLARRYRASHLAVGQINANCVGLGSLNRRQDPVLPRCAAALVVASRHPGATVSLICQLENDLWWMVAVHDGAVVTRSDQLFATEEQAQLAREELSAFYPGITHLDACTETQFVAWVDGSGVAASRLLALRAGARKRQIAGWFVALLAISGGLGLAIYFTKAGQTSETVSAAESAEKAKQAWKTALHQALRAHWLHGRDGTAGVLINLYRQPVRLAGWHLQTAQCVAKRTVWHCQSHYQREQPQASNQGFLDAAPAHWRITFTPLEQARAEWSIQSRGKALDGVPLNVSSANEAELFSRLQEIRPALPQVNISAPVPLAITAPLDGEGQPLSRPVDLPRYGLRSVEFRVPLRSVSLLIPHVQHIGWERIALTVAPQSKPSLTHSVFMAQLKGVLYETKQ